MPVARSDDGVAVAYRVRGSGPRDLVLLHPWGASGRYFDETVERLDAAAFRAVTMDLRGHGDSERGDVPLSLELVARDVLAVADAEGIGPFIAVGHSMGGKLAQYLLLVEPDRVQGLVLVQSAPAGALPAPKFVRDWVDLAGDGEAMLAAAVLPYLHRRVPEHALQRLGEDWARIPRAYLARTLELVEESFAECLRGVEVPALVIAGGRDPLHSTMSDAVVAAFPRARVELLDGGSELPLELPGELARAIAAFAAELP